MFVTAHMPICSDVTIHNAIPFLKFLTGVHKLKSVKWSLKETLGHTLVSSHLLITQGEPGQSAEEVFREWVCSRVQWGSGQRQGYQSFPPGAPTQSASCSESVIQESEMHAGICFGLHFLLCICWEWPLHAGPKVSNQQLSLHWGMF